MMKLSPSKRFALIIACIIGAVLVGVVALYTFPKQSPLTIGIGTSLRLPLARVYGYTVGLDDFFYQYDTLSYFESPQREFSDAEIRARVWSYIRQEYALRSIAERYALSVSAEEIERFTEDFLRINELSMSDLYTALPHFNVKHFKEHTILPELLKVTIARHILLNEDNEAKREIMVLHETLSKDTTYFSSILENRARTQHLEYEDSLLLITGRELQPNESTMLRTVPIDGITPVIVRTDGYRIYQIVSYFTEPEEAWQVRELFIPTSAFDEELQAVLAVRDERIYSKGIIPDVD